VLVRLPAGNLTSLEEVEVEEQSFFGTWEMGMNGSSSIFLNIITTTNTWA
jgi:hypothetical protein